MAPGPQELFATAVPGLEAALLAEVKGLPGVAQARAVPGGVEFHGDDALLYRANLQLRGAGRVLLRLSRFRATRFEQVVDAAAAVPWERYLRTSMVQAKVTCHGCRLYHSGAVAERLELAIKRRPLKGGDPGAPPLVLLRGVRDEWELSLDTSGDLLHFRGYRQDAVAAPLRENLAAALLLHAGYQGGPLWDLCCGSGTFLVEAALLRRRIAPALCRRFACQGWPSFDESSAGSVQRAARDAIARDVPAGELHGLDIDPQAIAAATANAERAGVGADLDLRCADLFHVPLQDGLGLVVANPPYGKRLPRGAPSTHRGDGRAFFTRLGRHLSQRFAGWQALILCPQQAGPHELAQRLGLCTLIVPNGGLPIAALTGRLPRRVPSP